MWRPSFLRILCANLLFLVSGLFVASDVLATTYEVTNTSDNDSGSFRDAILKANNDAGLDSIVFGIVGVGPHVIRPQSPLPTITDSVLIDGYTQPGALPATAMDPAILQIELDGSHAGSLVAGIIITAEGSTVRGLVINRFSGNGISLQYGGGNVSADI